MKIENLKNTAHCVYTTAIKMEKSMSKCDKALCLAGIALCITTYTAVKTSIANQKLKKRLKICEKKVERLEDRDFT